MHTLRRSQAGLSLVELMVALLIGVILTSGVISVFITSKASYSMNTGLGQVQEEGRFALQTLQPILVMAGNTGCSRADPVAGPLPTPGGEELYQMGDAVYGFEFTGTGTGDYFDDTADNGAASNAPTLDNNAADWSPALSDSPLMQAALNNKAVKYSDILMVHLMSGATAPISSAVGDKSNIYYDTSGYPPSMSAGQLLLAGDCANHAELITAATVSSGHITVSTPTDVAFAGRPGPVIGPAYAHIFFVGKGLDNSTSLYEVSMDPTGALAPAAEIVPGVENMQVSYGVGDGTAGGTMWYKTADAIGTDWDKVTTVRIALLVHSDPNTVDKAPSITTAVHMLGTGFNDSFSYKPYADRRMRRYFVETFTLRNRLPQ